MHPKSVAQQTQQNWYISRAYLKLREAKDYRRLGKCAEAVNSSFESVEFSVKALCKVLDVDYKPQHFLDHFTVGKLAEKIGKDWEEKKVKLLGVLPIVLSYSDTLREIARYGIERKDVGPVSPDQIFQRDYCDKVLRDAEILVDILSQIEKSQRWDVSKPIKIGVLNGFSTDPLNEKRCEPVYVSKDADFWEHYFGALKRNEAQKYDVNKILSSQISEAFAVIINPFGEAYPESNIRSRDTYEQIKFFIENGGVFANTAGFAFFYSWDHTKGERKAISKERFLLVPHPGAKTLPEFISFSGTLLYLDFGVGVTSDSPNHKGPHKVKTFQKKEDIEKFGKLGPIEVKEFRALRGENTTGVECIPILRAKCSVFGEIYPIAAIPFGKGFLLVGGFIMETKEEARLFANAVDAFCNWMSKKYTPNLET